MRVLVTGSRNWTHRGTIYRALHTHVESAWEQAYDNAGNLSALVPPDDFVLVHGACPTGADAIADEWAGHKHLRVERHPADWDKHGKRAGPVRNLEMVRSGIDLCLAFLMPCEKHQGSNHYSHGANFTANAAEREGIETMRYYT